MLIGIANPRDHVVPIGCLRVLAGQGHHDLAARQIQYLGHDRRRPHIDRQPQELASIAAQILGRLAPPDDAVPLATHEWLERNRSLYALGQNGVLARRRDVQIDVPSIRGDCCLARQPLIVSERERSFRWRLWSQALRSLVHADHTLATLPASATRAGHLNTQPPRMICQSRSRFDPDAILSPCVLGKDNPVLRRHLFSSSIRNLDSTKTAFLRSTCLRRRTSLVRLPGQRRVQDALISPGLGP